MATDQACVEEALATLQAVDWTDVDGVSPAEVGAFVARIDAAREVDDGSQ